MIPMTIKELRDFMKTKPTKEDAKKVLDVMLQWYDMNWNKVTVAENAALSNYFRQLENYTK